jgi:hypothetical protein
MYAHTRKSSTSISRRFYQIKGFPQNWGRYQCQLPAGISNFITPYRSEDIHDLVKNLIKLKQETNMGFMPTKYIVRTHISSVSG